MSPAMNMFTWLLRIAVGALFIFSGFVKANDITGFAFKLDEYWIVFGMPWLKFSSFFLSWFFSVFEIALGVALMMGYKMRITSWILLLMIIFFTFLTGYSWYFEAVQDCGCFGDAIKLTPWQSFMKDLILLVLCTYLFLIRGKIQPVPTARIAGIVSWTAFAGFGIFSYWCYRHLPAIDFIKEYRAGANIKANTTPDPNTGERMDHYFDMEFCGSCRTDSIRQIKPEDGFTGSTLYIVINNPQGACEDHIEATKKLWEDARKEFPALKICAGTNKPSELEPFKLPYCVSGHDEKLLMMMVRSSPGFMLLKDGVVVKKWSAVDMPEVSELLDLSK